MMKRQPRRFKPPATQSGFTIIESLLAIIIVTVLLVAIAPVIAISVANRVQSKRVEQATQAARTYIDGVRSGKITPPAYLKELNQKVSDPGYDKEDFATVDAPPTAALPACPPTALTTDVKYPHYCVNTTNLSLYGVDFDGDGNVTNDNPTDLIIQAFRSSTGPNEDPNAGYLLGVRVYRAASFDGNTDFSTTAEKDGAKVATNTAGSGDSRAPLVEMTTEIRGTTDDPYQGFCERLGCGTATPTPTP